jgi:ribosome-binding protein aMBF1 (putative translation factor)
MIKTKLERDERDAAFARLLDEMRGGRHTTSGLNEEIASARRRMGLTQAELARRIGTTQASIARLERDGAMPRMRTLQRLAEALGARLVVKLEID